MANLYKSIQVGQGAAEKEEYLPYLDGLRGVAILLVMGGHFFDRYEPGIGWTGVNLFFILSGYLITGKLINYARSGSKGYYKNFYARRFFRIFPLYYGCLAFFFLILPFIYGNYQKNFSGLQRDQFWFWTYLYNWRTIYLGDQPHNTTLDPFWSLAVEEQFYIIWPIFIWYLKGWNIRMTMISLIAVSIIVRILTPVAIQAYYSTLTACEPLLIGAAIFMLGAEGKLSAYYKYITAAALFAMAALCIIFLHDHSLSASFEWPMRYGYTFIDWIFAWLLYCSLLRLRESVFLRRILSRKTLIWLGKYSYGIYVFHSIFLTTWIVKGEKHLIEGGMNGDLAYLVSRVVGTPAVLLCSYASYHLYEKRFLRWKKYFVGGGGRRGAIWPGKGPVIH